MDRVTQKVSWEHPRCGTTIANIQTLPKALDSVTYDHGVIQDLRHRASTSAFPVSCYLPGLEKPQGNSDDDMTGGAAAGII